VQGKVVFSHASFEPQTTLDRPAPNVFRFNVDFAQSMAGLGAYAYHKLGWRRVVTFGEDDPAGWPLVGGFVAEFCSLGGNIVKRLWSGPVVTDWRRVVAQIPRRGVDGVAFASELQDPAGFFAAYGARHPDLARRVVVSGLTLAHTSRLTPPLAGMVGSFQIPFGRTVTAWNRHADEFRRAFERQDLNASTSAAPGRFAPPGLADTYYYNATNGLLAGLAQVNGDLSDGQGRLKAALRNLRLERPNGPARLDANRQAVAPAFLSRVNRGADGSLSVQTFKAVRDVEQTFNGYFGGGRPPPSTTQPGCRHGNPPSWARSG
jgi:branched-chain amino acid transport system substrate-binding protein